jgi:hypothetical protein
MAVVASLLALLVHKDILVVNQKDVGDKDIDEENDI